MLARAALACALVAALGAAGCRGPYRDVAERIANDAGRSDGAYVKVAALATEVGARLSGTPALERAIAWARDTLARDGHENVALEPVTVPHWSRGAEAAEIVAPAPRKLAVLALGGSVGTPPEGVTAEVAVVSTFEELAALGAGARGKPASRPARATGTRCRFAGRGPAAPRSWARSRCWSDRSPPAASARRTPAP